MAVQLESLTQYLEARTIFVSIDYSKETDVSLAEKISTIESKLQSCRSAILESDPSLQFLYRKFMSRGGGVRDDGKVAPGSSAVRRSLSRDPRFLLSHCCLLLARAAETSGRLAQALGLLRESLLWFPRGIHSLHLLASLARALLCHEDTQDHEKNAQNGEGRRETKELVSGESLCAVESYLRRADGYGAELQTSLAKSDSIDLSHLMEDRDRLRLCREDLCLLLLQDGRSDEADEILNLLNYKWRLSSQILNYRLREMNCAPTNRDRECANAFCVSPAVDSSSLRLMKNIFHHDSSFWSEHNYDSVLTNCSRGTGYFSYLYPLGTPARCRLEEVIDAIRNTVEKFFPIVREKATVAEWWVHDRVHSSGHQLHFDSDETKLTSGGRPSHPLASCVLFLGGAVGGPTLVTNQVLEVNKNGNGNGKNDVELATEGWLFGGEENRLVMFDANYLHGVIPGRGLAAAGGAEDRRITFMVGFWESISAKDRGEDVPGPGQPLPNPNTSKYSWIKEVYAQPRNSEEQEKNFEEEKSVIFPTYVSSIWEPIKTSNSDMQIDDSSFVPDYNTCFQGF